MDWVETQVSDHQSMDANGTAPPLDMDHRLYVSVYGIAAACFMLFLLIESAMFMLGGIRSSRSLHYRCLNTLMHAPVSWFDSNPKGRIISRFSADISVVDIFLPRYLDWAAQFLMTIIALCLVVAMVLPWMVPVLAFALCVFIMQLAMACRITRDAKRDANNAMSPVQSTLAEIEQGKRNQLRACQDMAACFISIFNVLARLTSSLTSDVHSPRLHTFSIPAHRTSSPTITHHMSTQNSTFSDFIACPKVQTRRVT